MKTVTGPLLFFLCLTVPVRADVTVVQKVEGAGPLVTMTVKIKGDKARIDANPQIATIVDCKTGEMINLMQDQKKIVRISADKMKAAVEMMNKYSATTSKPGEAKPKLIATGKKEKINGYDTDEYTYETPAYKATYWVAPKYPGSAAILKQLQTLNGQWSPNQMGMPDYQQLPGVPIKMIVSAMGNQITTTLTSITQDPINDAEFVPPKDFQEMKVPDLNELLTEPAPAPATQGSP